ncbi:MAG TPA: DinB family protein [Gemmatimonadales bacterium]|nr:DinB family protein [Gemmatimonadales bacterium]
MYRRIDDFLADYDYESKATLSVLRALTDASLSQRVTPEGRSAGRLAWHIAVCTGMAAEAGLDMPILPDSDPPGSAKEIADRYGEAACTLAGAVKAQWTDASLAEEVPMYGEMWTRGKALMAMLKHEAHHRGQLTVLMRQAGLPVPGVYGPSREEWASMGMDPQA